MKQHGELIQMMMKESKANTHLMKTETVVSANRDIISAHKDRKFSASNSEVGNPTTYFITRVHYGPLCMC